MRPQLFGIGCVVLGTAALASTPVEGACQQGLAAPGSEPVHSELTLGFLPNGLPLTTATGELSIDSANSLVPAFDSDCGWHLGTAFAESRVQLDFAGSSLSPDGGENETAVLGGLDGYANMTADLTGPASPLAAALEASFLSEAGDAESTDQYYFAGRSWLGFFDQRVEASAEVALALDKGEAGNELVSKYEIMADLLQADGFTFSSFAGFTFTDAESDNHIRAIGVSLSWERMTFSLQNTLETKYIDRDHDESRNQWDGELGFDLSGLHPFVPQNLSIGFELEEFWEQEEGAVDRRCRARLFTGDRSRPLLDTSWRDNDCRVCTSNKARAYHGCAKCG